MEARPLAPHNLTDLVLGVGKKGCWDSGSDLFSTGVGGGPCHLEQNGRNGANLFAFVKLQASI